MDMQATLEITVISAVNLENVRRFGRRMCTYVVVGTDTSSTYKSTRIDTKGGSYPTWNHNLQLELGLSERILIHRKASASVTTHVYCKTPFGKKLVGWTKVPFSDIVEGYSDPHSLHFLSYRLKTSQGKPQAGIINLSVRLLTKQYNYYSEQPRFNSEPVHYSEQGNIQNINYNISHNPQQMTAFGGTYNPSEFHQAGGNHMGNKNAAYCFPHAAPLVYPPPPPPYSSYEYSIK